MGPHIFIGIKQFIWEKKHNIFFLLFYSTKDIQKYLNILLFSNTKTPIFFQFYNFIFHRNILCAF
ncbi:hypothetical protein DDB_G0282687 [Dictyostelium discoideum AX4]|uniref:Uncharacterized protein n=1 Tax=Dictyostelium discoideum TaxID=44689 RepID=Q54S36_DICDI|nr:hypothetical protein DDB_G0282687 [Dictyostelium discoideum AX4]EAL66203.1 hypothetical protein DDB_G0282687 [Dictyostelium discoideum AX4]|eukprot:XP_640203.1 hypothetical protein DDB_G0282687 [Dictyostelium discoideum AX4]